VSMIRLLFILCAFGSVSGCMTAYNKQNDEYQRGYAIIPNSDAAKDPRTSTSDKQPFLLLD
jgi:hypothetical protein